MAKQDQRQGELFSQEQTGDLEDQDVQEPAGEDIEQDDEKPDWDSISDDDRDYIEKGKTLLAEVRATHATNYGIKFDTGDSYDTMYAAALKFNNPIWLRQSSASMKYYTGKISWIDKGYSQGIRAILNITWERPGSETRTFCRDLVAMEGKLREIYDKYHDKIEIASYENEPTTDKFWGDDNIQYYIDGLRVFCKVSKEYGVICADGSTHIDYYTQFLTNKRRQSKNVPQVKQLIEAFKDMPDLTYQSLHHRIFDAPYDFTEIYNVIGWIKGYTGKDVFSNEWHIRVPSEVLLDGSMLAMKEMGAHYMLLWNGGDVDPVLNKGTELTPYGNTYKNLMVRHYGA